MFNLCQSKQTNKQKSLGCGITLRKAAEMGYNAKSLWYRKGPNQYPTPKKKKEKKKKREEENTKSINVSRSRAGELAQQWSLYIMLWVWEGKKFFTWGWWDNSASQFSCRVQFSAPAWGGGAYNCRPSSSSRWSRPSCGLFQHCTTAERFFKKRKKKKGILGLKLWTVTRV